MRTCAKRGEGAKSLISLSFLVPQHGSLLRVLRVVRAPVPRMTLLGGTGASICLAHLIVASLAGPIFLGRLSGGMKRAGLQRRCLPGPLLAPPGLPPRLLWSCSSEPRGPLLARRATGFLVFQAA